MHELSFGNRLRQDHDNARRINALVETIDDLAGLVSPDALDERPHARLDEARRYKVIDAIVNIDMQGPAATLIPAAQNPADDKDGMRDFSPETVRRRRRDGFKFAHDILRPAFENRCARNRYPQVDRSGANRQTTKSHTPTAFFNYRATRSVFSECRTRAIGPCCQLKRNLP